MIQYNVTVTLATDLEQSWLQWMLNTHIPQVMATGCFIENRIGKLLQPEPEEGSVTYSFQYLAKNLEALNTYQQMHAPALQADHKNRYEGKFVAFRSVMQII